jgi:DNA-3-methyladenine glycosylase II
MNKAPLYLSCSEEAIAHLSSADPLLKDAIAKIGPIRRETDSDLFSSIVRHIIGQQISMAAQRTIWQRLTDLTGTIEPATITALNIDELQSVGMTFRKAQYIHSAAAQVSEGTLDLQAISCLDDERAIEALMELKGIGRWTAEMILLFGMHRPDILSYGDLAILRGMRILYGYEEVDRDRFEQHRRTYSPHGTIASLYLWAVSKPSYSTTLPPPESLAR